MIDQLIELQEKALKQTLQFYIENGTRDYEFGATVANTAYRQTETLNLLESLRDRRGKDAAVLKAIQENPYQDLRE